MVSHHRLVFLVCSVLTALATARPEPPVIGHSSGSLGPSSSSSSGPSGSLGYSYGPPPPSPSISVNSYGSATSEYGPPTQAPIIHKHVYVHVPPPEPEYQTTRKPFVVPPPQKHYKIVFIKAPSPPTVAPPVLPPVQQNEEKTLVYVLVKKQDEPEEIVIPTAAPTPPSKPEVYFIRYKTQVRRWSPGSRAGRSTTSLLLFLRSEDRASRGVMAVDHIRRVAPQRPRPSTVHRRTYRAKAPATATVYRYRYILGEYLYRKYLQLYGLPREPPQDAHDDGHHAEDAPLEDSAPLEDL
uniref:DUF243 domain-containing protein n=1 Tax=Anopheles atroparvus TaxID=41427 RepID=A0A182IWE2_ANOAO